MFWKLTVWHTDQGFHKCQKKMKLIKENCGKLKKKIAKFICIFSHEVLSHPNEIITCSHKLNYGKMWSSLNNMTNAGSYPGLSKGGSTWREGDAPVLNIWTGKCINFFNCKHLCSYFVLHMLIVILTNWILNKVMRFSLLKLQTFVLQKRGSFEPSLPPIKLNEVK